MAGIFFNVALSLNENLKSQAFISIKNKDVDNWRDEPYKKYGNCISLENISNAITQVNGSAEVSRDVTSLSVSPILKEIDSILYAGILSGGFAFVLQIYAR